MMRLIFSLIILVFVLTGEVFGQQTFNSLKVKELELPTLSADRALYLDSDGVIQSSNTTAAELELLNGVSGDVVDTVTSQTLSSKTVDNSVISDSTITDSSIVDVEILEPKKDTFANLTTYAATATDGQIVFATDIGEMYQVVGNALVSMGGGGVSLWVTSEEYLENDVVIQGSRFYKALEDHTSGTFATDLAAAKWIAVSDSILGQSQEGTDQEVSEFQVPNKLLTQIDTGKYLVESGNKNILENPSFEHSTLTTGWTTSGCVSSSETTIVASGKKSLKMTCTAQTLNANQDSTLYASQLGGLNSMRFIAVRSNVAGVKVCSGGSGTASTTNCVNVASDSRWDYYSIPTVFDGTSNGIYVKSDSSITGDIYIDDASIEPLFLDVLDESRIAGESIFAANANCLWTRTSTTQGAFTADADCNGPTIKYSSMGSWQTTDVDLPVQTINNLPAGVYKATFYINPYMAVAANGSVAITDGTTTCEATAIMATPALTTLPVSCVFRYTEAGNRSFTIHGSSASSSVNIDGRTGTGYSYNNRFQLDYYGSFKSYSASCGVNCVDTFTAKVSSGGVVSDENIDWINGNSSGTGLYTLTFNSGIFTVAPNCFVTQSNESGVASRTVKLGSTTSSTVEIRTQDDVDAAANLAFNISCQKQGTDFVASRTIVGSFKEVPETPGINKIKTCYYKFGGASSTLVAPTNFTTGTATEIEDNCGTGTPPTYAGTGLYANITFASGTFANSSPVHCDCRAFSTTTDVTVRCDPYFITGDNTWASNSSGGYVLNVATYNGSPTVNSHVTLRCDGYKP
jgi:hypothetical protein